MPLAFLIYLAANLDRANVGFAKLRMSDSLRFSDAVFGLGIGIFFIGYLLLQIAGAILVERWSARKWFALILFSWGMVSALMAFVKTPSQFYLLRFLLGITESGLFPGMTVYFTKWFVAEYRPRAFSVFFMAGPLSLVVGAPLAGILLDRNWLGLVGWQWMFIIEGLPTVALGLVTLIWLDDRPHDAKWLTPMERDHLEKALATEALAKGAGTETTLKQAFSLPNVWLLALGIFAVNLGGYGIIYWLPSILKNLSGGSEHWALFYSTAFYIFGMVGAYLSGQLPTRGGDSKRRCVGALLATGVLLGLSAIPSQPFILTMMWLCLTAAGSYFWNAPFWTLSTITIPNYAAAVAIGVISMAANLAGYVGNHTIGLLRQAGLSDKMSLFLFAVYIMLGGVIVSLVRTPSKTPA